jgi:hypothetical protein
MTDVNLLKQHLIEGEVTVTFTKADGTERVMRCTKKFDLIPAIDQPLPHDEVVEHVDLEKVYDLDIQEWRSYKPSRVIKWVV